MSARDKHYKPRRFRDENDDKAERKLRNSGAADRYVPRRDEEYAAEPGSESESSPSFRFPSKVNVPAEDVSARRRSNPYRKSRERKYDVPASKEDDPFFDLFSDKKAEAKEAPAPAEKIAEEPQVIDEEPQVIDEAPEAVEEIAEQEPSAEETAEPERPVDEEAFEEPVVAEEAEDELPAADEPSQELPEETADDVSDEDLPVEDEPAGEPVDDGHAEEFVPVDDHIEDLSAVDDLSGYGDENVPDEGYDPDELEYVMPGKKSRKHRKKHRDESLPDDTDSVEGEDDDYVFEDSNPDDFVNDYQVGPKPKRKKSKAAKVLITILCIILALIIGAVSTFLIMNEIGRKKMHSYDKIDITAPDTDEAGVPIDTLDASGRVIKYNGVSYAFNENVISIVFIGTDEGTVRGSTQQMGDAIYVLTIDTKSGDVKILGISRDTMTDVDVYSSEHSFIDTEKLQLAYAYTYTGENVTGGQNTLTSISRLFYGLPMNNYFAINLDALTTLNDAIGGVTLTSSMTFVSPEDGRTIHEGETVTLHGEEAEAYVRKRDKTELESNNDRMQRQQEYIRAFISQIFPAVKKDISVVTNLYNAIKDNSDSTLDITKLTYIASTAISHMNSASDIEYINLKGKVVKKGDNAQMYVSNEDTIRTMLDIFYTPIQNSGSSSTSGATSGATAAPTQVPATVVEIADVTETEQAVPAEY